MATDTASSPVPKDHYVSLSMRPLRDWLRGNPPVVQKQLHQIGHSWSFASTPERLAGSRLGAPADVAPALAANNPRHLTLTQKLIDHPLHNAYARCPAGRV